VPWAVVAGVGAAPLQGRVHIHVRTRRGGLGVHAAVHLDGHTVDDGLAGFLHVGVPGAEIGHGERCAGRAGVGPVALAGDVAVLPCFELVLVDADDVIDLRHREARRARCHGDVLVIIEGMAVGIGLALAGAEAGLGIAIAVAGQQVQTEVGFAVIAFLHGIGRRPLQQRLDLVSHHFQGLAVGVGDRDLVKIRCRRAMDLQIIGVEVPVGHGLGHVQHHTGIEGLRAGVGHAAVVALPVAGALRRAVGIIVVHLAEVG